MIKCLARTTGDNNENKERMEMTKDRIVYLDYMRVLATLGVIFIHVSANNWYGNIGSADWISYTIYEGIMRFSVPLFFMISGVLFLHEGKEINVKRLYLHNILRLLVFLVFWAMVYQIYNLYPENGWHSIGQAVINILNGDTQIHLWYIYSIIGIYIMTPVIKVFTDHATKKQLEYFLVLFFVFGCVLSLWNKPAILAKFRMVEMCGYVGYFILGAYLSRYNLQKKTRRVLYLLGLGSAVFTVAMTCVASIRAGSGVETYWTYLTPNVFFMSVAVFVFLFQIKWEENWFYRIIASVSDCSLGIYGVHMLFIFFLWRKGINTLILPGIISVPLIVFIVFILSYCTVRLMKLIPILRRVV